MYYVVVMIYGLCASWDLKRQCKGTNELFFLNKKIFKNIIVFAVQNIFYIKIYF
jgi:hypothetical protein